MTPVLNALEVAGLRATVVANQLDMVCSLQREQHGAEDPYGHDAITWANLAVGIACHYWEEQENELVGTANATVTRERIVLPANTDVTTADRVLSVTGIDATQVAGVLNILEVIKAIEHTILIVRAVR